MNPPVFALSFGFVALIAALQPARSEPAATTLSCGERGLIVAQLESRYGESRHGIGIASNNAVLEVFVSSESGSFTVIATLPGGPTCLVASGSDYQSLAEPLRAQGKGV